MNQTRISLETGQTDDAGLPQSFFAPARRATLEKVRTARDTILRDKFLTALLEGLPNYVMILNEERQVLAVNSNLKKTFGTRGIEELLGKRPGEVLGCIFSTEEPGGCGTCQHCATCGAAQSIMECQLTRVSTTSECRLTLSSPGNTALDLEVISTPVEIASIPLTICTIRDISDEKRRNVLERLFFHDVINTAGGIHGLASMLLDGNALSSEKELEYKQWMVELSNKLIDEITHHRKLVAAEKDEFKPINGIVEVRALMNEVHALYASHDIAEGRSLVLGETADCMLESDAQVLRRILGNLVKNALEATPKGGIVTMACTDAGEQITFSVNNPGVMPEEVQLQIFQRSFSTKQGTGRGIGTYSVRLFGERYLKGKVGFVSREPEGTTFTLTIPKSSQGS